MPPLLLTASFLTSALAADPAPEAPKTTVKISGLYSAWGLSQHNFLFGKDHPLDDASYVVQMLRVRGAVSREHYGIVAQVDAAQGWWGLDNSPNTQQVSAIDPATGAVVNSAAYNVDSLFGNKDTNYGVHLDTAAAWFEVGPVKVQAGRQPFLAGHRLVLDEDLDGVVVSVTPMDELAFDLSWAKISEGRGALTTPSGALMSDTAENTSDADLFGLKARYDLRDRSGEKPSTKTFHKGEAFALFYRDGIADDWSHFPNGLGYAESRFSPNVNELWTFGLSGEGKVNGLVRYKAEADVLTGKDRVDNADTGLGQMDVNNGDLFGWNLYGEGTVYLDPGVKLDLGLLGGAGSGDDDVTSGRGNVNKVSTQGFFPLLNVWEDSVMPDVQGISPQGLGSPVSRGYRELENTLVGALKVGAKPVDQLRLEVVGAYLATTQPVRGFDAAGVPTGEGSSDLGWEVDANGTVWIYDDVSVKLLWGWFQPGDAALKVVNGNTDTDDAAWELKTEFLVKF
ncbi:MAG: hypothetical protein KC621_03860 [Myxococcales bacterium]|nr:hypothetical protein [Myxococcales bacterium]